MAEKHPVRVGFREAFERSPMVTAGAPLFFIALLVGNFWVREVWFFALLTLVWVAGFAAEDRYWETDAEK